MLEAAGRSRKELGERFATPATSSTWSAAASATLVLGRRPSTPTSTSRPTRAPARDHAAAARLGRPAVPGRRERSARSGALKDGEQLEITTFRAGGLRRGPPQARASRSRDDIETDLSRRDFTINAMAVRLPDGRVRRSVRRRARPRGEAARHAAGARGVVRRRPAADAARGAVRGAARRASRPAAWSRRCTRCAERLEHRVGRADPRRAATSCSWPSDRRRGLALLVDTGLADEFLPELPALQLEQDPVHRHKDVLRHTYAVVERCEPDLVLRLAALLHDVGKPQTREITAEGVQFHHHEVVGARMARGRGCASCATRTTVIDDVVHAGRAAPAVPRVRRRAGPTPRSAATSATPGRCSTG